MEGGGRVCLPFAPCSCPCSLLSGKLCLTHSVQKLPLPVTGRDSGMLLFAIFIDATARWESGCVGLFVLETIKKLLCVDLT